MLPPSPIVIPYSSPDEAQHLEVLINAYQLFCDRSQVRGDMWRMFPAEDKIRELRERVSRIEVARNFRQASSAEFRRGTIRSDAVDIINYATFLIKQIDEGAEL